MTRARFRRGLAIAALAGLVLRIVYAYAIVRGRPLLGDALEFQQQANLLAAGHGLIEPVPWLTQHIARASADKPPVYPALEAVISLLGGTGWAWHDVVGILAGTATVAVTGLLGRRVAGERAGLLAAGIAALYPLLIATDGSLRSESVFALLVTTALLAAVRLREAPSARRAAVLGGCIALAALTRSEALLLIVLLPFGLAGARRGVVAVAACALVLSPWLVRCWIAFGEPVLISTNVGGLLAGANCGPTYSGPLIGQWTLSCLPPAPSTNEALASDHLRTLGLRYAADHAGRLPVVIAARIGRSFDVFEPAQNWGFESFFEGRSERVEEAGVLVYYLVALLALAGGWRLRARRGPWGVLGSPLVLVLVVSITGYGFTRFRAGAEPALIVLAAVALDAALAPALARTRPGGRLRRAPGAARGEVAGVG